MSEPRCPALTTGKLAACRFCVYTGGGPSGLCVKMIAKWQANEAKRKAAKEAAKDG